MILVAHPTGNANVRAVLRTVHDAGLLAKFVTTLGWSNESLRLLPASIRARLSRRAYDLPSNKIEAHYTRELVRLLAAPLRQKWLSGDEGACANIDNVWQELSRFAAQHLRRHISDEQIDVAYAYEDCAEEFFTAAGEQGVRRAYDLPIAYWQTAQRLLREEAERYPEWEPTLGGTRDSSAKLERKARELDLAELVICPSAFVLDSLPQQARETKRCVVAPFGSPDISVEAAATKTNDARRPLRVLFAGALTQRKGLADVFAAMKLVDKHAVELVVMGSLLKPISWYRSQYANFTYEPPRPHADVLRLMRTCDVFVLPSIVEGRALVQQEAMASGLPLIATKNAGADDLICDGKTGFLVPIRSPTAIAEKISWCADNREAISGMAIAAQERARTLTWRSYGDQVLAAIKSLKE